MPAEAIGYQLLLVKLPHPGVCPWCQRRVNEVYVAQKRGHAVRRIICCKECAGHS